MVKIRILKNCHHSGGKFAEEKSEIDIDEAEAKILINMKKAEYAKKEKTTGTSSSVINKQSANAGNRQSANAGNRQSANADNKQTDDGANPPEGVQDAV